MNSKDILPSSAPARQSSIYALTLDEFQSLHDGGAKDLGSMNMDELLKSIWAAEESQLASASLVSSSAVSGIHRQGSLSLSRTLSQKTVDEVWRDLLQSTEDDGGGAGQPISMDVPEIGQKRPPPLLGEMTLEDFLVRAGVVKEDMDNPIPSNGNHGLGLGYVEAMDPIIDTQGMNLPITTSGKRPAAVSFAAAGMGAMNQPGLRGGQMMGFGDPSVSNGLVQGVGVGVGAFGIGPGAAIGVLGSPATANQASSDSLSKGNGDLSSVSPTPPYVFSTGLTGRKSSSMVEKVADRRQRRMIKNRESAARSRARKQAYTMELEAEVAKLKEQNEELQKKQVEIVEMQKNQAMKMTNERLAKKLRLRRALTGPW